MRTVYLVVVGIGRSLSGYLSVWSTEVLAEKERQRLSREGSFYTIKVEEITLDEPWDGPPP